MRYAALPILFASLAHAACLPVTGDTIQVRDLVAAVPAFSKLDPAKVFGYSPVPGARRSVSAEALNLFARRNGIDAAFPAGEPGPCFEWASSPVTKEQILAAVSHELDPEVQVGLAAFSQCSVPAGQLVFPRAGLNLPPPGKPDAAVLWRGKLVYAGTRSIPVWATVTLRVARKVVVAAVDLPPAQLIRLESLRVEERTLFPFPPVVWLPLDRIVGKSPRRTIRQGQPVSADTLIEPPDVSPGEKVTVTDVEGGVRLEFPAEARTSGHVGDSIVFENPSSHKRFRGVLEGRGRAKFEPEGDHFHANVGIRAVSERASIDRGPSQTGR